jgi:hypothetical protein
MVNVSRFAELLKHFVTEGETRSSRKKEYDLMG